MRLGVLGGTFDPVHLGHLLLAEQARESLELDRVLLIPAARPPHKPDRVITPWEHRYRMLVLALEGNPVLFASDAERASERPSYTAETLRRLRDADPEISELWLLLGSDSLAELPTWREPEAILRLARLAVYPRPECPAAPPPAAVPALAPFDESDVRRLEGPRLRLSSSELRERARAGRSLRFLVPDAVRRYIEATGIYREVGGERAGGEPTGGHAGSEPTGGHAGSEPTGGRRAGGEPAGGDSRHG